uniref:Kinesin light chain n=1 Tax=Homo sapiens TaxID=9606 RepID=Q13865_HUMAN|nr:kinesin light chain [Homo sapiens]
MLRGGSSGAPRW